MKLYLLPGFGGSGADWQELVSNLDTSTFIPIALDYPSHRTDLVAWLAGILSLEKEPYALCAYSMGGRLALLVLGSLLEASHAALPCTVVLLASGFHEENASERELRQVQDANWAALLSESPDQFWKKWYAQELFKGISMLDSSKLLHWENRRKHLDSKQLSALFLAMSPANFPPLEATLKKLLDKQISVLYIAGELDKKYSSLAQAWKKRLPQLEVQVVPNVGHVLPLEAPAECAKIISRFWETRKE